MSGIAPGQTPPPKGTYVFPYNSDPGQGAGSVATEQQTWTQTTIKQGLGAGGPVVNSFSNAQDAHNALVKGRFDGIEKELGGANDSLGNHENRIIKLESGNQVAFYYSNDIWHKPMKADGVTPSMDHYDFVSLAGGGGGARSKPSGSARTGWFGGGQGGYTITTITEASGEVDSSVNVYIGAAGQGAANDNSANGINGQNGTNTYFQDSGGAFSVAGGGPGGTNTLQTRGSGSVADYTANGGQAWGYSGSAEIAAQVGGGGYLASGGFAGSSGTGTSNPGGNGQACPSGKIGPGGGGGGGGPYSTGGAGGFPAGGGGAGGPNGNYVDSTSAGPGGPGAVGFGVVISYPSP